MACYSVQKYGFTTISEMMTDIVAELTTTTGALVSAPYFVEGVSYTIVDVGAGPSTDFTSITLDAPALNNSPGSTFTMGATPLTGNGTATILKDAPYFDVKFGTAGITGNVILQSNISIDPLAETVSSNGGSNSLIPGAWRLCFNQINDTQLGVHAATGLQLKDDGTVAHLNDRGVGLNLVPTTVATSGTTGTVTVTVTFAAQTPTGTIPFPAGSSITMAGVLDYRYNGSFTVLVGTTTTVTYTLVLAGGGLDLLAATTKGTISTRILREPVGNIGADWTGPNGVPASNDANQIWINRTSDIGSEEAYPMSYALTLTNRGIFLGVWQDSQEEIPQSASYKASVFPIATSSVIIASGVVTVNFAAPAGGSIPFPTGSAITISGVTPEIYNGSYIVVTGTTSTATFHFMGTTSPGNATVQGLITTTPTTMIADTSYGRSPFRWFLIQRSVDRLTGNVRGSPATANTSRCPVYCISGTGVPTSYRKFVIRETDVVSPSRKRYAAVPSEDTTALINPYPQQSLTESGEFIVTFINNLTTSRFKYADELDMVGTVSAEVVGAGTSIDVTVYGEAATRTYTAVYANQQYGTGMRLMVLTSCSKTIEDSHLV